MRLGRPRTDEDAAKCFMSAASKGHPFAAYMLAGCYSDGNGVPQDYALGTQWLEKSANLGLAKSQHDVGHMYARNARNTQWLASRPANPTDPKANMEEAVRWYRCAADQGYPEAEYRLAVCYSNGEGLQSDSKQAFVWHLRAAEHGHIISQTAVAGCYDFGVGCDVDKSKAMLWNAKAARNGSPLSETAMGLHALSGVDMPVATRLALKWFERAANHGQDPVQNHQGSTQEELMRKTARECANNSLREICVCASGMCPFRGNLLNSKQLKDCGACRNVWYCSVECQRIDWRARHRQECTRQRQELPLRSIQDHLDHLDPLDHLTAALSDREKAMHESVD